ncbi:three-helix bundle dimerization domain-containing protein [Pseudonocardia nigra]|uniref:three-helix bundle dimerization domain-containing protein n=1 Tax=Pseudonocardia nigra TaxID=1921578 RepID=UPI00355740AD
MRTMAPIARSVASIIYSSWPVTDGAARQGGTRLAAPRTPVNRSCGGHRTGSRRCRRRGPGRNTAQCGSISTAFDTVARGNDPKQERDGVRMTQAHGSPGGQPPLRSEIDALERAVSELVLRFDGAFTETEIYRCVFECYADVRQDATVRTHLVALTRRLARERLTLALSGQPQRSSALAGPVGTRTAARPTTRSEGSSHDTSGDRRR